MIRFDYGERRQKMRLPALRSGQARAFPNGGMKPTCKRCDDEVETLVSVKVDGKAKKLCEDCADRARESAEIAEQSESVVQQMMGFKGRR